MQKLIFLFPVMIISILISCNSGNKSTEPVVLFSDSFDISSQGGYQENVVHLPPPKGLGFIWKVLEGGYLPVNWILSDEYQPDDPLKGFWVIPPDKGYMEQGGRSVNSVLFAKTPIPEEAENFVISFKQYRGDNDPITYVLGAEEPDLARGFEFGYETQVPGTDSTTRNAFVFGALGDKVMEGMALNHRWANHKIEVNNDTISWIVNDSLMIQGQVNQPTHGYFGIRQRYERGTRYDDVKIEIK